MKNPNEWKITTKLLNEDESKWEILINIGWNEIKEIYDRRYKWVYASTQKELRIATNNFFDEIKLKVEMEIAEAAEAAHEQKDDIPQETIEEYLLYWLADYAPVFYEWEKNTRERTVRIVKRNIIPSLGHIPVRK